MTQHPTIDHSVQEANLWLKAVEERLHLDGRRDAYSALRATLHALRDRLTPESAVHLGAQMPMVIRGLYYEGWRIAGKPTAEHSVDAFCAHVARELPPMFPMDARTVTQGVFAMLSRTLGPGIVDKVIDQLPTPLKALWRQEDGRE